MLVATFLLNGGLYHTILLLRFLDVRVVLFCSTLYFSSAEYPVLPRALSYTAFASLNSASELEIVLSRFSMELGIFLGIHGG